MPSGGLGGGIGGGLGGVDNDSHDFGPHKMRCVLCASTWHNSSICEMRLIPTLKFCIFAELLFLCDQREPYIRSANFTRNARANRELMIRLTGPCVQSLIDGVRDAAAAATRM